MSSRTAHNPKRNQSLHPPLQKRPSTAAGKKSSAVHSETATNGTGNRSKPSSPEHQLPNGSDRTVKKLRLSKALTIPEATTVSEACRRMAQRRIDAALLTDSNGLLSGIFTDKDMVTRVLAEGLRPEQTVVSKIMTRNPIFVSSDTLAIEALQTMVHGKFTHLPVVENGEVVALLDITKCLYDAISKMEKAAEQGSAIAAAVEGVERHWGSNFSSQYAFIDTLRERMFKPSLSTMITENTKVAMVLPSDPVCVAAKKMRELRVNCVVVGNGGKPQGILTSRDILMRVVANSLSPELTLVEKVMTSNPECATMETTILDALHLMHDRKFLHIPVVDHDGCVVGCLDVLQISQAAISMVRELDGGHGTANDTASMMMQKFWDSALPPEHHDEEFDTHSDLSATMTLEAPEAGRISNPPLNTGNSFVFKFTDQKGRVHRLNCCSESLAELITSIKERLGPGAIQDNAQFLYEDEEGDKVLLLTDSDLVGAVNHARSLGWKVLRLHLDNLDEKEIVTSPLSPSPPPSPLPSSTITIQKDGWSSVQAGVLAGAVSLAGMGLMVYLRKSRE